ncbi:MAG: aminoacyl-tRNA hydrolase [Deltaproteobacteria bacterium]|nr:aminoacyl-tRNA hydrolase [Deltaproteobacteria bacterium]
MTSEIKISEEISIPLRELRFTASRSSGPGGQNVNKVSTRVTLWFDIAHSPSLSEHEKELIRKHLPTRINKEGVLRIVSQKHRTQASNRHEAVERFVSLLRESLYEASPRRRTKIPRVVKERRLAEKKYRSRIKAQRSKTVPADD